jgi:DNA polymerase III epsilon subunit family exonuclease
MAVLGPTVPTDATFADWPGFVFDTETTGVDVHNDRVVELGAVVIEGGAHSAVRRMRIDPQMPIPKGASDIHGIRDEHVRGKPTFAAIAARFVTYLDGSALGAGAQVPWLCGYNATGFDGPLLNAELARVGHAHRIEIEQIIDPMVYVRWHLRHLRSRSLESACAHFGISLLKAHSALDDATATAALLLKMIERGFIPRTIASALAEQARFARIMKEEWDQWSYWLYRDRESGKLRLGAGSHCGSYLGEVSADYLHSLVAKVADLPAEVRARFLAQVA